MAVLLISDLHLRPQDPDFGTAFIEFLRGPAREASAVYILGDLFEYWIGDDVSMPHYATEIGALRALSDSGVPLYVMRGNRDFLLGPAFAEAAGAELLSDPLVIDLEGEPTLLSHGDIWCTADRSYQRWRRFANNRLAQAIFLALPARLRRRIADKLRGRSRDHGRMRPEAILDVTPAAVEAAFAEHGVHRIIHGHTHRPATHRHAGGTRIVLPDWRPERRGWLVLDGEHHTI